MLSTLAHVWVIDAWSASASGLLRCYRPLLEGDEVRRLERFLFQRDQHAFLLGRGLARTALSWCAPDVGPGSWRFELGHRGRPEVAAPVGHCDLRFNISHTPGRVACIVARGVDCGIDVEYVNRKADIEGLGRSVLSAGEQRMLEVQPEPLRMFEFYRYWTLKEAYAKARGEGLALPFSRMHFDAMGGRVTLRPDPVLGDRATDWQFLHRWAGESHSLAIALRQGNGPALRILQHPELPGVGSGMEQTLLAQ